MKMQLLKMQICFEFEVTYVKHKHKIYTIIKKYIP